MAKMGRPTDNPRTHQFRIMLNDSENEFLDKCSEALGISKADVMRMGLKKVENEMKNQNANI